MLYWLWLSRTLEPPSKAGKLLLAHFSSPEEIYHADEACLKKIEGLSAKDRKALLNKDLGKAEQALAYCREHGVSLLTLADEKYPTLLKEIDDPPVLLYYRGVIPEWNTRPCFAIVGSRDMSQYGATTCFEIAYDLAKMGCITVSGMALGNDGVAGAATLAAEGATVAVLGCGIDFVYPPEHTVLYDSILREGGIIVTEYAPSEGPNGYHFPVRNRIISGLSRAVIVIEGHGESGAMITAKHARRQGRDVCALPGRVDDLSAEGPLLLLKHGAIAVTCADDLYDRYHEEYFAYMNGFKLLELRDITLKELFKRYQLSVGWPRPKRNELKVRMKPPSKRRSAKESSQRTSKLTATAEKFVSDFADTTASNAPIGESEMTFPPDSPEAKILAAIADDGATHPDDMKIEGMSVNEVLSHLTMMEIEGLVIQVAGGKFRKL